MMVSNQPGIQTQEKEPENLGGSVIPGIFQRYSFQASKSGMKGSKAC